MSSFAELLGGFGTVLSPANLLFAVIGVTLGTLVGVLPGIGPAVTIALLLPVTYNFDDPIPAFIMFAGIYYGAMYGGSTTSILLNTPGESASVATAIEGHEMAKRGQARAALATAAIGSFVAALISTVLLALVAKPVASIAISFRATDYFALMILALVTVTSLVGRSLVRGLASLLLGISIGFIGLDGVSGEPRFTFDSPMLFNGIDSVLLIIGLFAIGETLYVLVKGRTRPGSVTPLEPASGGFMWLSRNQWHRSWAPWLRGTAFGFPFGVLPSGGAELPTFLSYSYEKQRSRGRKEFGKGAIEGVAGPEAANNASFSGVLVPLLTLGLPTSATAAVMLAAFKIFNLQPGPQLFDKSPDLVWALIASLFIGNVMLLALNLPLIRLWVKVLEIPRPLLYAGILVFATLGIYSVSGAITDILIAYAIGIVGFLMRQFDFPIAPTILGAILGPELEDQFRRALSIGNGDLTVFLHRPLTVAILALALLALLLPYAPKVVARLRGRPVEGTSKLAFADED
ncbi:tripartite tricarboxylate transporter permease [Micromonospora yasonensis]|uniref:tripartite tricarboxylate transporter permease n=1 Tax=Micromonospora yasonensis TaxID=1128667 RepID=UPI00222E8A44|nr:tripartite tricarboxylate transporter permease [Micromonospora yasonensis]MCW3839727.1 tripartite tricarboxylate transporter permease [Micromonospora yasonensis]